MVYYFYYLRDMAYRYMGECRHAMGPERSCNGLCSELAAPCSEHGPSEPQRASERAVRGAEDQPGDVCARQVDLRRGRLVWA